MANRLLAAGRAAVTDGLPACLPRPAKRLVAARHDGPNRRSSDSSRTRPRSVGLVAAIQASHRKAWPTRRWPSSSGRMRSCPRWRRASARRGSRSTCGVSGSSRDRRSAAPCGSRPRSRSGRGTSPRRRDPTRTPRRPGCGPCLASAFERELGVRADSVPDADSARERHAAVVTLLNLADDLVRDRPTAGLAEFLADTERRAEAESGGAAAGVELLTYHRAKGLEWDAVFLPALEEGTLPIRQATEPRRARRGTPAPVRRDHPGATPPLAVVGSPAPGTDRAREPAIPLPFPRRARAGPPANGSPVRRRPSDRSQRRVAPGWPRPIAPRSRTPCAPGAPSGARTDQVAPFIVFHDATIEAIAARRPRTIPELRRVPGIGPTKLERYGEELIAVILRSGRSPPMVTVDRTGVRRPAVDAHTGPQRRPRSSASKRTLPIRRQDHITPLRPPSRLSRAEPSRPRPVAHHATGAPESTENQQP